MSENPKRMGVPGATSCFNCQWRERSEWCVLDHEDVRILDDSKSSSQFKPGQVLFHQGDRCDGIYTVVSGTVAIRKSDIHGNTVLVRLRHEGETIGYRDFFTGSEYSTSAEALSPVTMCFVHRDAVQELLTHNPALGLGFLNQLGGDLKEAEEALLRTSRLSVRTRMAHLLLTLKDRYAEANDDGSLALRLPLSRQDIADILGTRAETVARTIHALEVDNVATFSGRNVIIPDLDSLLDEIELMDE